MRKRPTIQTLTFSCPICGYHQRGYFAVCPTVGCEKRRIEEFIATMTHRIAQPLLNEGQRLFQQSFDSKNGDL